ncbi:MAG TPA: metabolite traffic protein EboE [Planctomycetaceae bacterium]|nr:metabolite traffic protein EboE [Planctomycetaceae bacterium]
MTLSTLPLGYCTNVHPGLTPREVLDGLRKYTVPVGERLKSFPAAGLWLAQPVIEELVGSRDALNDFCREVREMKLSCYTLNAFPYGNFHSDRVKEQVYLPDWSDPRRLDYTFKCAAVLAELLGDFDEGSISTVPLGFKQLDRPEGFLDLAMEQLVELAIQFEELYESTGKRIRLAIEPEPLCLLETTSETIDFFAKLGEYAATLGKRELVRESIGVCYDVCHQAVEFEDVDASLRAIDAAGIRLNKIHITCAIDLPDPAENEAGRRRLAEFVEPRYLHQTFARFDDGTIRTVTDLSGELCLDPPPHFRDADRWRIHYHVPVNADSLGPLGTTRNELKIALKTVAALDQTPHLEVETYTWSVLPGDRQPSLVDGLADELQATRELLDS